MMYIRCLLYISCNGNVGAGATRSYGAAALTTISTNFIDRRCSHSQRIVRPVVVYHPSINTVIGPKAVVYYGSRSVSSMAVERGKKAINNGRITFLLFKKNDAHYVSKCIRTQ